MYLKNLVKFVSNCDLMYIDIWYRSLYHDVILNGEYLYIVVCGNIKDRWNIQDSLNSLLV